MVIPVGTTYTAKLQGRAIKPVTCQRCQGVYVYVVERVASGEETSWLWLNNDGARMDAAAVAQRALDAALAAAVDPVACPACGWYQEDMVAVARRRRGKWLRVVAIATGSLAVFVAFLAWIDEGRLVYSKLNRSEWNVAGILGLAAATAATARHVRCTIWNPNADTLWKRRNQPKEAGKAMKKADFDRMEAESRASEGGL